MEKKNLGKSLALLAAIAALGGGAAIGAISNAQTTNTATTSTTNGTTQTQAPPANANGRAMGHRPLGQDGIVQSINGSTITMAEEADEGGAIYTVDASGLDISNVKVGDKIFVDGTVTGNSVKATAVSSHFGGQHGEDAQDGGQDEGTETPTN